MKHIDVLFWYESKRYLISLDGAITHTLFYYFNFNDVNFRDIFRNRIISRFVHLDRLEYTSHFQVHTAF